MLTIINKDSDVIEAHRQIARLVIYFWLAGWYCKLWFFAPYLLDASRRLPVIHPMFPQFFLNPNVSNLFYFLPLVIVPLIFIRREIYLKLSALLMVVCAVVMNLHINAYNDATFVTSFWVGLWLVWFVFHCHEKSNSFRRHAKVLGLSIVGIVFLGGFVGKLTPEYWNGQVMLNILTGSGKGTPLGQIIMSMSSQWREFIVLCLARIIIVMEGVLALAPILPTRFILVLLFAVAFGFCFFSTWMILSVLACLLGLVLAVSFLERLGQNQ